LCFLLKAIGQTVCGPDLFGVRGFLFCQSPRGPGGGGGFSKACSNEAEGYTDW